MSRMPRISIEGALYYVTSRGDNNENIFKDESDYNSYMELLKKSKEQYSFKLFAFCLLPNHLHLLIEIKGNTTISEIMHSLNSNYTKYFNSRHDKKGHLFQERFSLILAEKEPYLLPIINYIHLNPKALGMTSDIGKYIYSSYLYYCSGLAGALKDKKIDIDSETKEVSKRLGGKSYADTIVNVSKADMEAFGKEISRKPILGSDLFIANVKERIEKEKIKADEGGLEIAGMPINKTFIFGGLFLMALLGTLAFYLYNETRGIKIEVTKELTRKEAELDKKLKTEKTRIYQGLDEKYRADKVSFEAMAKRLEFEKKRVKELESAPKTIKK